MSATDNLGINELTLREGHQQAGGDCEYFRHSAKFEVSRWRWVIVEVREALCWTAA